MRTQKKGNALDITRLIAALLVICNHTSPLALISTDLDFILARIIARLAVPFFFMVTGYFILAKREESSISRSLRIKKWCIKLLKLYGIAILIYLPINYYANQLQPDIIVIVQDLFFNGTFYHLWYFPAVLIGVWLVNELMRIFKPKTLLLITTVLYLVALGGDSYYGLISQNSLLAEAYQRLFLLFEYTRNGLLLAPLFLVLGATLANRTKPLKLNVAKIGFVIFLMLMIAEGLTLRQLNFQRHDSMYLFLVPTMFCLFEWCIQAKGEIKPAWRNIAMLVYVLHPMMILVVRAFGKIGTLKTLLVDNNLVLFLITSLFSFGLATFIVWAMERMQPIRPSKTNRSWTEINTAALRHNYDAIQNCLPPTTKIMPVIKADGYGHGACMIAKEMERIGVEIFAVATLTEAIELREQGIAEEILILGYTPPEDFLCLTSYNLTQTIMDAEYARCLNEFGRKVKVHINVDTGMHRLGIGFDEWDAMCSVYKMKNLKVEGIYSHLCVADSFLEADQQFTQLQIKRYIKVIDMLKENGINPGKTHLQSTYGILNYPEIECDYVRIGIGLYGALSDFRKTKISLDLKPVLSLKTKIISIRTIDEGESVGYGREFTASRTTKVATLGIGYADGLPRTKMPMEVMIHGIKVPIIGRICMDQCMIDITGLDEVTVNETVTLIGNDEGTSIQVENLAQINDTISNEILSRLSKRLVKMKE